MHTISCTGCLKECLVAVRYATPKHKGPHSSWRRVSGSIFGPSRDPKIYLPRSWSPCRALGYRRSCTESRTVHIPSTAAQTDLGPRPYDHDGSQSSPRRSSVVSPLFRSLIFDLMAFQRRSYTAQTTKWRSDLPGADSVARNWSRQKSIRAGPHNPLRPKQEARARGFGWANSRRCWPPRGNMDVMPLLPRVGQKACLCLDSQSPCVIAD